MSAGHEHRYINPDSGDGTPIFNDPVCGVCGLHPDADGCPTCHSPRCRVWLRGRAKAATQEEPPLSSGAPHLDASDLPRNAATSYSTEQLADALEQVLRKWQPVISLALRHGNWYVAAQTIVHGLRWDAEDGLR